MRGWMLVGMVLVCGPAMAADTVHSLNAVPGALKTPEGKSTFAQQMAGAEPPDLLGLTLPAGMTAASVAALVLPPGNAAPLNAVGVKPVPGEAGLFAAIVCTGGDVPAGPDDARCSAYSGDAAVQSLKVYAGLLRMTPGTAPALAVRPVAVNTMADWRNTDLPDAPDALQDASGDSIPATSFSGFDLAPYVIAPGVRAFGLRGKWEDGYSGGMAEYSALYLFAAIDGALTQVFTAPMSEYRDIAGDWHKDGTRDHQITDVAKLLSIARHASDGYSDVRLTRRGGKGADVFRWSAGTYKRVER